MFAQGLGVQGIAGDRLHSLGSQDPVPTVVAAYALSRVLWIQVSSLPNKTTDSFYEYQHFKCPEGIMQTLEDAALLMLLTGMVVG